MVRIVAVRRFPCPHCFFFDFSFPPNHRWFFFAVAPFSANITQQPLSSPVIPPTSSLLRDERIPERVRGLLNVEAGYNDGIVSPVFIFALVLASDHTEAETPLDALARAIPEAGKGLLVGAIVGAALAVATNVAERRGLMTGQAYRRQYGCDVISVMPSNLYGPGDNFDLMQSHVVPALIVKAHNAKLGNASHIEVWGTGTVRREFLYVDDAADGMVHLLKTYSDEKIVNLGPGEDVPIRELVELVCDVVGYKGEIVHDLSKPDGTPRKLMSADKLRATGWSPKIELRDGIAAVYRWFLANKA